MHHFFPRVSGGAHEHSNVRLAQLYLMGKDRRSANGEAFFDALNIAYNAPLQNRKSVFVYNH